MTTSIETSRPTQNPATENSAIENPGPPTSRVFADPVGYLATFGIESELVEFRALPAAA